MGIIKKSVPSEPSRHSAGTTIIAEGNKFSGEMKIVGRMHIDGAFEGTIQSLENISVGKKGHVSGQIHARHINVSGLLEGEIFCDELHIEAGGLVKATVTSKQMSISPKGNFVGQRKMLDETSPVELPAPEEASNKDAEKGKKTAQEKAVN